MPGLPTGVKFQRAANSGQQVGMPLRISMHICMHVNDTHMHSFIHIHICVHMYICTIISMLYTLNVCVHNFALTFINIQTFIVFICVLHKKFDVWTQNIVCS